MNLVEVLCTWSNPDYVTMTKTIIHPGEVQKSLENEQVSLSLQVFRANSVGSVSKYWTPSMMMLEKLLYLEICYKNSMYHNIFLFFFFFLSAGLYNLIQYFNFHLWKLVLKYNLAEYLPKHIHFAYDVYAHSIHYNFAKFEPSIKIFLIIHLQLLNYL